MKISEWRFERWAAAVVALLGVGLLAWLFFSYLLPIALPFLLSFLLSLCLRPLNSAVARRTRLPVRFVAVLSLLLSLFLLGWLIYGIFGRLVAEIRGVVAYLGENPSPIDALLARFFPEAQENGALAWLSSLFAELSGHMGEALMDALPPLLGSAVLSLPNVLLFLLIAVVSAFYFSLDADKIGAAFLSLLPATYRERFTAWRAGAFRLGVSYLRSYAILTAVVFVLMLVGLLLLGVKYALLLSLLLAALDILPVVGVGTVLVPWGIFSLLLGDVRLGIGLLLLFGVSEIVRQVLEPRLVGAALGIHPLLSLFSLYLGTRLFGFFGLILGPFLAVLIKVLLSRIFPKTKNPSNDGISVGHARTTLPERRQREHT